MQHCVTCAGSGEILGNGMQTRDCSVCDGMGEIDETCIESEIAKTKPEVDRRSAAYRSAIKDIMAVNKNISKAQAENLFDEAYNHG